MIIQFENSKDVIQAARMMASLGQMFASNMAVIEDFAKALHNGRDKIVTGQQQDFSVQDAEDLAVVAGVLGSLRKDLDRGNDMEKILDDLLDNMHNDLMTIRQDMLYQLGMASSAFYASKLNLDEAQAAFNKSVDSVEVGKPVEFVEI